MASHPETARRLRIRGTDLAPTDTPPQHREKLARITLDSMVRLDHHLVKPFGADTLGALLASIVTPTGD